MITLALSKGRIFDDSLPLLRAAGIEVLEDPEKSRKLILATSRADVRVVLVRASDVPTYVRHGGADLGVAGLDVLLEDGEGLYKPLDLKIARCRMSVATRADFDYVAAVKQGSRIRVATKYTQTARAFFAAKGVHVDLIKLYGSMELAPLTGLADAIVDLVSSGSTLKANDLVEVERIMDISSRLVVNPAALKLKREAVRGLIDAFAGGGGMTEVNIRRLSTADADFEARFQQVLHWSAETDDSIETRVADIIADVRARGDAAVLELTTRFDGVKAASMAELEIGRDELRAAADAITPAQRHALHAAAERVRDYHQRQLEHSARGWQYRDADGTLLGQKVTPLDRVGIYVPGGKAAYPSSVLMNAIPAQVAGVGEIVMVVPTPGGERNALVLAAAFIAGAHRVFTIGGAQAIAALAYGTATVPRVDKITGPGNAYVASAKRRVFGQVGIDMIAGPSEILVLADGSAPADWVAMDLFSQAEHDELAQSILLCPDAAYIDAVRGAINRLLPGLPRRDVIRASLEGRGALIHTRSLEEACAISNRIAPEHLEVSSKEPARWEPLLKHAGAIFLGAFTSESLGDYCAGPNHVLPTSGTARFSSPLGVYDFVKRSSLIEVSEAGAQVLGPIAAELAYGEGLQAHARAAELRLTEAAPTLPTPVVFSVRPVDRGNFEAVLKLKVAPGQTQFVAAVDRSLAQVAYTPAGRAVAMYDGEVPVGMMLLYDARLDDERPASQLYLWRLLVDARYQRRGYGRLAMAWLLDETRRLGVAEVGLSHVMQDGHAGGFYRKLGFAYTGEVEDGEHKMLLRL